MIRDLQARSGCRIDVDQNVPPGAPRIITYRGTVKTVAFARRLVEMLCTRDGKEADLPLGEATRRDLIVPANVIGKIIGRGGEMIRELQSKSQAKIQVDHTAHGGGAVGADMTVRKVTLTGTDISVRKAEEMIGFLIANPALDAMVAIGMLIREKTQGSSEWGSGPPYITMPNNGQGISNDGVDGGAAAGGGFPGGNGGGYGGGGQSQYGGGGQVNAYGQQPQQQAYGGGGGGGGSGGGGGYGSTESEIFPCAKMYMGRIIGQKGVTINDLQKRSTCDIQINQEVPHGQDCEITIKGSRQGIDTAKQMLTEIIQMGPNHPYAGGGGNGGGGGGGSGAHGGHGASGGGGGYGRQGGYQQQSGGYGQQQGYPQETTPAMQQYGQQPAAAAAYGQNQGYYTPQQQQQQQQQQQHGYAQHHGQYAQSQQAQAYPQQYYGGGVAVAPGIGAGMVGAPVIAPMWKAATAPDGQTYYYNEKTGESSWEKPPGM